MDQATRDYVLQALSALSGEVGFYFCNLTTGEELCYGEDTPLVAASVIKLPVMVSLFEHFASGKVDPLDKLPVMPADKLPSCGVLTYLGEGLQMSLLDLCTLMIIVSDNTATNMLIRHLGIPAINQSIEGVGLRTTALNRLLFDAEQAAKGVENYITAREIGLLLKRLYHGQVVSPKASEQMLNILKNQRLNAKIPPLLPPKTVVAHKTGEDSGITHDVGIVYAPQPFVVCFCGNGVNVPAYEDTMRRISRVLYDVCVV